MQKGERNRSCVFKVTLEGFPIEARYFLWLTAAKRHLSMAGLRGTLVAVSLAMFINPNFIHLASSISYHSFPYLASHYCKNARFPTFITITITYSYSFEYFHKPVASRLTEKSNSRNLSWCCSSVSGPHEAVPRP